MYLLLFGIKFITEHRFWTGIIDGSRDRFKKEFSHEEIDIGIYSRDLLVQCEPWAQHLTNKGIQEYNKAISKGQCELAKSVIDKSQTQTSAPWCITALKQATVLACGKCAVLVKEALPQSFY